MSSVRFLLDSNVFFPLEATKFTNRTDVPAEVLRLFNKLAVTSCLHPAQLVDINNGKDLLKTDRFRKMYKKYPEIEDPPTTEDVNAADFNGIISKERPGSNPWVDNQLLYALFRNAADFLITEDGEMQVKGRLLKLGDRIMNSLTAKFWAERQLGNNPKYHPEVKLQKCHNFSGSESIFDSIRADYLDFDVWFKKCQLNRRDTLAIYDVDKLPIAVCILNKANVDGVGTLPAMKLCTFKVAESFRGVFLGEALLREAVKYARINKQKSIFITTYPKQTELIRFLGVFGFVQYSGKNGELVFSKELTSSTTAYTTPLDYNIKFGPAACQFTAQTWYVPIQPLFADRLMPEATEQLMFRLSYCGFSIRKVYLCNAKVKRINSGDTLLFYRSQERRGIIAVGVVDEVMTFSKGSPGIIGWTGKRSVYLAGTITAMNAKEVLGIKFRLVDVFLPEMPLSLFTSHCPQSITQALSLPIHPKLKGLLV